MVDASAPPPLVAPFSLAASVEGTFDIDDLFFFTEDGESWEGEEEEGGVAERARVTPSRVFSCDLCPARFSAPSKLVVHQRVHSGEKPFGCDLCPARFSFGSNLIRHQRVHSGEKPFGCDLCPARFSRRCLLTRHQHTHAAGQVS